jgi:hypothetical protein
VTEPRVLLNVFHPNLAASRANRLIIEELRQPPGAAVRDIQEAYPDWRIHVAKEQELLLAHDLIVFQYPFYWYNCPALMKPLAAGCDIRVAEAPAEDQNMPLTIGMGGILGSAL